MKMFSSEENCSRLKSSQEYIICFRGIKEEKAKVGRESDAVGVRPTRETAHT